MEQAAEAVRTLAETARAEQRPDHLGELEITITPPGLPDLDTVRRYADAGVHRLVIELQGLADAAVDPLIDTVGQIQARLPEPGR